MSVCVSVSLCWVAIYLCSFLHGLGVLFGVLCVCVRDAQMQQAYIVSALMPKRSCDIIDNQAI